MAQIPKEVNAASGQTYLYVVSSDQKQFQLFAYLENSQDPDLYVYTGKSCSATLTCNFGVSSSNTTPKTTLP